MSGVRENRSHILTFIRLLIQFRRTFFLKNYETLFLDHHGGGDANVARAAFHRGSDDSEVSPTSGNTHSCLRSWRMNTIQGTRGIRVVRSLSYEDKRVGPSGPGVLESELSSPSRCSS